jgi:hypothetical protein
MTGDTQMHALETQTECLCSKAFFRYKHNKKDDSVSVQFKLNASHAHQNLKNILIPTIHTYMKRTMNKPSYNLNWQNSTMKINFACHQTT